MPSVGGVVEPSVTIEATEHWTDAPVTEALANAVLMACCSRLARPLRLCGTGAFLVNTVTVTGSWADTDDAGGLAVVSWKP